MSRERNPLVSYVVLTKNSEKTLNSCLQSIVAQRGKQEILVIDGNSTDRTLQIADKFDADITILTDDNLAMARNKGIELSRGMYIAFVDSDIILPLKWTRVLLRLLTLTKCDNGVIAGISSAHKSRNPTVVSYFSDLSMNLRPGTKFVDAIYFQSAIFNARILKSFKSNPRWKRSGEDTDLSYQLREMGFLLMHTDEVIVEHYSPETLFALLKRQFRYGINFPKVLLEHNIFLTKKHWFWFLYLPILIIMSFNIIWFSLVFISPYLMHIHRYWSANNEIDVWFGIINGLKFQAHTLGITVGLIQYIIRG